MAPLQGPGHLGAAVLPLFCTDSPSTFLEGNLGWMETQMSLGPDRRVRQEAGLEDNRWGELRAPQSSTERVNTLTSKGHAASHVHAPEAKHSLGQQAVTTGGRAEHVLCPGNGVLAVPPQDLQCGRMCLGLGPENQRGDAEMKCVKGTTSHRAPS